LSLVALIDGGALYLLGNLLKSDQSMTFAEWGSQKIGFLFVILLFITRSLIATGITWIGLKAFAEQEVIVGQQNVETLDNTEWELRSTSQLGAFLSTIDRAPNALVQGFLVSVVTLFSELITALVIFGVLLIMEPVVAIASLLYFLFVAVLQHKFLSLATAKAGMAVHDEGNKVYDLINDGFHLSKLFSVMPSRTFHLNLNNARSNLAKARGKRSFLNALPRYFMEAVLAVGFLAIAIAAYYANGEASMVASVSIFAAAGFRLLPVINRIQGLALSLYGDASLAESALIVRDASESSSKRVIDIEQASFLELENISFRYSHALADTIRNISFSFERGKKYAIVGPSGSGKTTLVDICLGLLKPYEGTVAWSNHPTIGYVPQETFITTANMAGNISIEWFDDVIDTTHLLNSAIGTRLIEPGDHDSPFAKVEKLQLSGGQKQRLGIARALYRNPDFLVLDEATSALDAVLENEVMESLNAVPGTLTMIIVAHRLATIQNVDQILYIDNGVITGHGTFSELRQSHSKFAEQIEIGEIR
jgi:ABC-type multidrug transport system fused ATPase/permease subunit